MDAANAQSYMPRYMHSGIWMRLMHGAWQITRKNGPRPHKDISPADRLGRFTGPLFLAVQDKDTDKDKEKDTEKYKDTYKDKDKDTEEHRYTCT